MIHTSAHVWPWLYGVMSVLLALALIESLWAIFWREQERGKGNGQ